jgi:epoxyqueuosine reductase
MQNPAKQIKCAAAEIGYAACGITGIEPFHEFGEALRDRIARFPEAADLYKPMLKRVDPLKAAPWAKSLIVTVRRYGIYRLPPGLTGHIGRNYLCDRRDRECPDNTMPGSMTARLKALGLRVRRGGVPDRWAGARAGVTAFGRNTFAYSPHGSWINIESWLVDADLPRDTPTARAPCPPNCRACIDACPTGALVEPYVMRIDRCIAYLTYHATPPIAPDLWRQMGSWIYGCDVCQEVCPLNKGKWEERRPASWLIPVADILQPESLASMDMNTYRSCVHPHFWYIPVEDLARWHANARRAVEHANVPVRAERGEPADTTDTSAS